MGFGSNMGAYPIYKGCLIRQIGSSSDMNIVIPDVVSAVIDESVTAIVVVQDGPVFGKILSEHGVILNFRIDPQQVTFFRDSVTAASSVIDTSVPLFWLNNQVYSI